jgi:hypothetical protein
MNTKTAYFLGITAIIFVCCYIYQAVYPHVAGQILISYYSDIKMIMSGQVPDGYSITPEQSALVSQFINLTYIVKALLGFMISAFGAFGIIQFSRRMKKT